MEFLAISTEDGRILFYDTKINSTYETQDLESKIDIPTLKAYGQIGVTGEKVVGRIKDFEILDLKMFDGSSESMIIVTGSSDGAIRLWRINKASFLKPNPALNSNPISKGNNTAKDNTSTDSTNQIGQLIGTYETGNRITCLKAFTMLNPVAANDVQPNSELNHFQNGLDLVDSESRTIDDENVLLRNR